MSTTGFPGAARKGSATVPSRCSAVFCAAGTGFGCAFASPQIVSKQTKKRVRARIGKRGSVIDRCLNPFIGARVNSKILYAGGSLYAIGAPWQAPLYYLWPDGESRCQFVGQTDAIRRTPAVENALCNLTFGVFLGRSQNRRTGGSAAGGRSKDYRSCS